jgi:uncharacterized protein
MAERDSYQPGTFSWAELLSNDTDGAKAFYTGLFGWTFEDRPIGDGGVYTMFSLGERHVGALHAGQQEGMPPVWNSYVTVEDADATTEKAKELGANVLAGPFDVPDAGRMSALADPQGGVVSIWQPRDHIGAGLVNAPGAVTLNQLNTSDTEAAGKFYADLFGWDVREQEADGLPPYFGLFNEGRLNGGMMDLPEGSPAPPHWLVYFGSEDVDASVASIRELGGQVLVEPMPIPGGRIAVAQDPQDGIFALFDGRFDD